MAPLHKSDFKPLLSLHLNYVCPVPGAHPTRGGKARALILWGFLILPLEPKCFLAE